MASFLADEHIRGSVVRGLRDRGVDVRTVQEVGLQGAPDSRILEHARVADRVLLTNDRDFLTLASSELHPGLVFQTTQHVEPGELIGSVVGLLATIPDEAFPGSVFYVP